MNLGKSRSENPSLPHAGGEGEEWFPHTPDYIKTGGGKGKWNLEPKRTAVFYNAFIIKDIQNKPVLQTP